MLQPCRAFECFSFVRIFPGELDVVASKVTVGGGLPITILVSSHDMCMVQELFPRTIVMDEGLIVADGDTREILSDEKFLNEHGLEKP